jgi:hypothetical protein
LNGVPFPDEDNPLMMAATPAEPDKPLRGFWVSRLLRLWGGFTLGLVVAMAFHQSDSPMLFGRYSLLVGSMLAGLLVLGVGGLVAGTYLSRHYALLEHLQSSLERWRRCPGMTWIVIGVTGLAVAAIQLLFLGDHLPAYAALRAYLGFSIMLAGMCVLVGGESDTDESRSFLHRVVPICLVIPVGLAVAASSVIPPLMMTDEAFTLSMAVNLRDFGQTAPLIFQGIHVEQYAWGGMWLRGMALWISLLGEGLAQGRHYLLAVGGVATILTWIAAAKLYDRRTAWCTALVMAFMVLRLGVLRPDLFATLYVSAAMVAYAWGQRHESLVAHLLTGLFLALTIDAAPIAYMVGVAAGLLYLARMLREWDRLRFKAVWPLLALALGGGAGIGIYMLTRFGMGWFPGSSPESGYLTTLAARIVSLNWNDLSALLTDAAPLMILALVGGYTVLRKPFADRGIAVMSILWLLLMMIGAHYFRLFYIPHGLPLLALLAGVGLAQGLPLLMGTQAPRLTVITVLVTVWLSAWVGSSALRSESLLDVVRIGRTIAEHIPDGATVVGAEPYYFGMVPDFAHTFRSGAYEQTSSAILGRPAADTWAIMQPDYVIFSQNWLQEPHPTPGLLDYMQQQSFRRLGCWQSTSLGVIELWGIEASSLDAQLAQCPTESVTQAGGNQE